ncbi:hypothetical protein ACFLIM_32855 [Nonomuraea sp. M3C6]|uniref:Uncharacterized protein n=1 Tax=Nonomuraea marmarensis TaxID=3351344 RepID=A0ABW7AKV4_9ACTN
MGFIGYGLAAIAVGAILTFVLTTRPPGGFDLQVMGVILILGGALTVLLALLQRTRPRGNRSTSRSRQDGVDGGPPSSRSLPTERNPKE